MSFDTPRILVACDFDERSGDALEQAHARAQWVNGELGVCHVLPSPGVQMLFPQRYAEEVKLEYELEQRARAMVTARVTSATGRASTDFEIFVERGSAYAEIVRCAESWRATLTVVGSHEPARPGHIPGTGVAEKVARYAHGPVLVARPSAHRGLVVCATDLSSPSLPAVAAAVLEARLRGAKLEVLHVIDQGVPLAAVSPSEGVVTPLVLCPELLHDLRQSARAEIDAVLAGLDARATSTIVEGHAGRVILTYVEEHRPELVVVGTRGRTGLTRLLLGSVAEHVVRAARTSVLVVRLPS
jgi:nucleotide-binding universal stress UspA family protein